jgi:hypothetical protein
MEKPQKYVRRTNKDLREEVKNKEKAQGKQQSIESSMVNIGKRRGGKGLYPPILNGQTSSNSR